MQQNDRTLALWLTLTPTHVDPRTAADPCAACVRSARHPGLRDVFRRQPDMLRSVPPSPYIVHAANIDYQKVRWP